MGVSVENQTYLDRIDHLRKTDAPVKFVSFEPQLGPLPSMNMSGIYWAIVGGESGPGAKPMEEEWVQFGRELAGQTWDQMPDLAVVS